MAFQIGFTADHSEKNSANDVCTPQPRKSLVQVYFPGQNRKLAYYNDQFDLKRGDLVYVDGKLAGILGRVISVSYSFKIRLSEYKRVIAVADTTVKGRFVMAGSHFITFDPHTLPFCQVISWFRAPVQNEEDYVIVRDGTSFSLDDLNGMDVSTVIAERGHNYYLENRVRYLSLDGTRGHAIVEGSKAYELEFQYQDGEVSDLICSCPCSYTCKHAFAAMLQLCETLEIIERRYAAEFERTGCFAAVDKNVLFDFAINRQETGSFTLG